MKNVKPGCFIVFLIVVFCASCATGIRLSKTGTQGPEIKGNYNVIFFGCNYLNDLETIAFLDKEGDQYTFGPFAPDFKYRIEKGVEAGEAFEKANKFVQCNSSFSQSQMSTIKSPSGEVIGYEIKPLYQPFTYGVADVLNTYYWLINDKVVIRINLDSSIENMLQGGAGREKMD